VAENLHRCYDIRRVSAVVACDTGLKITFEGNVEAILPAVHPDFENLRFTAEWSLEHGYPVGVVLEADRRLVALNHSYQSQVRSLEDDPEDSSRVMICFWAFCSVCYLTRDHPDFERIRTTLEEAHATGSPVRFANDPWAVEGETEIWLKLLDVRPVSVLAPAKETDGAAALASHEPVPQAAANPER
jgi:hypothetical protein